MTRLAFTADLHVDSYGTRIDPTTGLNARLVDYLTTLRWVSEEAARRGCTALVVGGDFTERRHPSPWLVSKIVDAIQAPETMLTRIRVYLRGNHDGEVAGSSIVTLLNDDDWSVGVDKPEVVPIDAEGGVVLACIPYLDRHWLRAQAGFETVPDADIYQVLGDQFLAIARGLYAQARRDYPKAGVVLVCHQALAGAAMSDSQAAFLGDISLVVDSRALAAIGFEAVVAGHLHRHQVVVDGPAPILYTGSIERVDFGEEHETKGFIVADVGPGRFEWEFVETPARRFVTIHDIPTGIRVPPVDGAIVRVLDVPPDRDVAALRAEIEDLGAFEVTEIRVARPDAPAIEGGMAEGLAPQAALEEYFVDDEDREALVERGRAVLAEVAS